MTRHSLSYMTPIAVAACLLLMPSPAMANAGTPMMWAGMLHLLVGNALIGLLEAAVISRLFKLDKKSTALLMVVANYLSMILGALGISALVYYIEQVNPYAINLYNLRMVMVALVVASLVASVLIEWPFCHWALRLQAHKPIPSRFSLRASLIAQCASYALLVPFYLSTSPMTAVTRFDADRTLSFAQGSKSMIYYIAAEDGDVYSIRPDGSQKRKVMNLDSKNSASRLFVRKAETGHGWNLWVHGHPDESSDKLILADFAKRAVRVWQTLEHRDDNESTGFSFGHAADLRRGDDKRWDVDAGFWAAEGLHADARDNGERLQAAVEVPFLSWYVRNATVLPGELVICQMGNQLVVVGLDHSKIGVLGPGRGPIAIVESD